MKYRCLLAFLASLIACHGVSAQETAESARPANGTQIHLWEDGAPGFEERKNEAEVAEQWWVANIHNPSITAYFPPAGTGNGTSVLVCPGGGHRELVFGAEGVEAAEYLNKIGVAAFALKYRLGGDKLIEGEKPYSAQVHARQDGHRAMRLIRSHAEQWGLNPDAIGIMGFSAGGQVAHMVVYDDQQSLPLPTSNDPIDQISSQPNFQIIIYPGGGYIPDAIPADAPPALLIATMEDRGPARILLDLAEKYRQARRPVELHLFAQGAHGYNMGNRSKLRSVRGWPDRMADWMYDSGLLAGSQTQPAPAR